MEIDNRAIKEMTKPRKILAATVFGFVATGEFVAGIITGASNSIHSVELERVGIAEGLVLLAVGGLGAVEIFRRKSSGDGVG